jgi:hypothetical protein
VEETEPQKHRGSNQLVKEAEEENEASDLVPCASSIGDHTEETEQLDGGSAPVGVRCRI